MRSGSVKREIAEDEPVQVRPGTYTGYREELADSRIAAATRMATTMGWIIQNLFLVLDYYSFPDLFADFFLTRMVINVALAACYVTAPRHPRTAMVGACYSLGIGMLALIFGGGEATAVYYTGLILVFLGIGVVLPMTAAEAGFVAGSMASAFALGPWLMGDPTPNSFGLKVFFVFGGAAMTTLCAGFLDRMRFQEFKQRQSLVEAEAHLREMDQLKTRFSANVHHELRTPLTLMLAPLEGLRAGDYGDVDPKVAKTFKTMHVNGQRLLKLINNLLDLAKLESSQFDIHRAPVELDGLVENIIVGARPMAERKNIELASQVPTPAPTLFADSEALEKILVNLVGNSLKFTESGGRISVGAEAVPEGVEIFVRDTGIGLATDQLGRVFDRFAQIDASATRMHEGTGIGLSLTQELIALHGGRIGAESDGLGQGTTMRFYLPTGTEDTAPEEAVVVSAESGDVAASDSISIARAELGDDRERGDGANTPSGELSFVDLDRSVERWEGQQGEFTKVTHAEGDERPEILVADDNADMRELISFILQKDFRVRTARNGREAMDQLQGFVPDLIVSDIMMPEMSGIELCKAVKSDERLNRVPVMLVSSKAESEMKIEGLELGADDYVTKPFHPRELLARARSHAALHRARRDLAARNEALATALDDLKMAEDRLIQSERLAAVGEIAAGIAHEVNNPVNYALNAARSLGTYVEEVTSIAESAAAIEWSNPESVSQLGFDLRNEIEKSGGAELAEAINELTQIVINGLGRTQKLVGDLRDYASPTRDSDPIEINLVESVNSALQLVSAEIERAGVAISWKPPADLPPVVSHPTELSQVVLNLIKNAAEAIGERHGSITVEAAALGHTVTLRISDDGPGVPDELAEQIFDPFFTTKAAGEGTGLGLAVCRKIVAAHGGDLDFQPNTEGGATFVVTLSAADTTGPETS